MKIIKDKMTLAELLDIVHETFGDMAKAVVDVEKEVMAVGGELHSDGERLLIENGSKQENLWGVNLRPDAKDGTRIEFDSLINIRPSRGNRGRTINNPEIKKKITGIVDKLIVK